MRPFATLPSAGASEARQIGVGFGSRNCSGNCSRNSVACMSQTNHTNHTSREHDGGKRSVVSVAAARDSSDRGIPDGSGGSKTTVTGFRTKESPPVGMDYRRGGRVSNGLGAQPGKKVGVSFRGG